MSIHKYCQVSLKLSLIFLRTAFIVRHQKWSHSCLEGVARVAGVRPVSRMRQTMSRGRGRVSGRGLRVAVPQSQPPPQPSRHSPTTPLKDTLCIPKGTESTQTRLGPIGPPGFQSEMPAAPSGPPGFSSPPGFSDLQHHAVAPPGLEKLPLNAPNQQRENSQATTGAADGSSSRRMPPSFPSESLISTRDAEEEARLYEMRSGDKAKAQKEASNLQGQARQAVEPSGSRAGSSLSDLEHSAHANLSEEQQAEARQERELYASGEPVSGNAGGSIPSQVVAVDGDSKAPDPPPEVAPVSGVPLGSDQDGGGALGKADHPALPSEQRLPQVDSQLKDTSKSEGRSSARASESARKKPLSAGSEEAWPVESANLGGYSREDSDSDDSLVLQELRPASPPVRGGTALTPPAEDPSAAGALLLKPGAGLPSSTANSASQTLLVTRTGSTEAPKPQKPTSYSWKLNPSEAPAVVKPHARDGPTPALTGSTQPRQTGGQRVYKWQLNTGVARTVAASKEPRQPPAAKSLSWRRGPQMPTPPPSPPQPPSSPPQPAEDAAAATPADDRPSPPMMLAEGSQNLTVAAATDALEQGQAMDHELDAETILDFEQTVACLGQMAPYWQASQSPDTALVIRRPSCKLHLRK